MSEALTVDNAFACDTISDLLRHAATWDRESQTYAQEVYTQWPERWPKEVVLTWADAIRNSAAELRRLHAEVEALRADAERYRWLRDKADYMRVPEGSPQVLMTDEFGNPVSIYREAYPQGETLDAAIDAAIKQLEGK